MTSPGSQRRRLPAVLLLLALTALVLSGCARVHVALAVAADDTVTGEVIVATRAKNPTDKGPQLQAPARLSDEVQVEQYTDGDFVGSKLTFSKLTFEQFNTLSDVSTQADGRYRLNLDRVGGRVVVSGKADLNSIGVDDADFQLKISAPGGVDTANGDIARGTVSWPFTPGRVNDVEAALVYDDPQAPSPLKWTLLLAFVVAFAGFVVVRLASRERNPPAAAASRRPPR